jgi:DNA primase
LAGRIRDADVALVRERSPIADVISEHVQLRAAGGALKGLCPFHDEKTPSFNVRPQVGKFHCFGCGAGGDVIAFVSAVDSLTFPEAVERLARRCGVTLTYEGGGPADRGATGLRQRLIDAHRAAAEFYAGKLAEPEAASGREFLAARGFDREAATRFGVGYAPSGWDGLTRHLLARRFTREELITGGLAKVSSRGSLIDRFHRRLVWPIHDLTGDVVGFGARKLADDDPAPKYLNTPETPLFKKGSLLYGASLARREIARRYQVVVVEGYTDVMACHLAGVPTAVATCGTAFGAEHVSTLRRLLLDSEASRGEVIFTFDGDAAGQQAALKAFDFEERFVTQTFVAGDSSGLDPCELRLAHGDAAVRDLVARRVPLFEFAIRGTLSRFDLNTTEGRLAALDAAAPLVNRLKDRGLRHRYAVNLDAWLGFLDEKFVLARVAEHQQASEGAARARPGGAPAPERRPSPPRTSSTQIPPDPAAVIVEREALKAALQCPGLAGPAFDALPPEDFTVPAHRAVRAAITQAGGVGEGLLAAGDVASWVSAVSDAAPDDATRRLVTALAVAEMLCDHDVDDRYVAEQLDRLEELRLSRRIVEVKSRVQRLNPVTETEAFNRCYAELISLEQHKRQLRERSIGAVAWVEPEKEVTRSRP